MIWAFPLVCLPFLFLASYDHQDYHFDLLFKVFLHNLGFASFVSFIYRKTKNFGLSVLLPIVVILIFSLITIPLLKVILITSITGLVFYEFYGVLNSCSLPGVISIFWSFVFLVITFLPFFSMEFSQLDSFSRLLQSYLNNDTLYHLSISAMWKKYQFVSHGLHGLGELAYHFGSHVLMAGASSLLNISSLESYSHFFGLFCVPLLFLSIVGVSEEYFPSYKNSIFYQKLFVFAGLILGSGILVPTSLLYRYALWPGLYQSESYIVSLILFMAFLSILKGLSEPITYLKGIGLILVLLLVSFSKVSTGFFGLSCFGFWTLFSPQGLCRKEKLKRWILLGIVSLLLFLFVRSINPTKGDGFFSPFHFLNTYVDSTLPFGPKLFVFILLHFLFPLLAMILYISLNAKASYQRVIPRWWFYNLVFMTLVGAVVILSLYVLGGSGFYVSNVSMYMAIPLLIAFPQFFTKNNFSFFKYTVFIFIIFLLGLYSPKVILTGVLDFRRELNAPLNIDNQLSIYIEKLNLIRKDERTINSLIYIPRSEIKFWKSEGYDPTCRSASFIISGIAERPAIYGWPADACYNLLCSDRFQSNGLCEKSIQSYGDNELLIESRKLGFSEVIILTKNGMKTLR
ncbi:hypothetical protein [Leptospira vanthielii]|uniref:DUF2079 domain-containing protein n=1 Tax=Leptospira vanthielii TaxID=293085 RepID=A0ABY2NSR3_9LEPT|nr:hypothetical protein [Leptospira vanthielii]TGM60661.1 hypothetical protein EHQ95_01945 [Leptospira vanthielii]